MTGCTSDAACTQRTMQPTWKEIVMKTYLEMTKEELTAEKETLEKEFQKIQSLHLNLDLTRGKPSPLQLDLSMEMYDMISSQSILRTEAGTDCRNYGSLDGIDEAKRLMAGFMDCEQEQVIVHGNASLSIMYDTIARSMLHGVLGSTPWCRLERVKFLCPVPGYDRHFAITQYFGIEMIQIPMKQDGPDMDLVEKHVNEDPAVKGIWCVPKYENDRDVLLPILPECEKAGNPDIVYEFCSTSKVTFSGAGISAMGMSDTNRQDMLKQMSVQTIGHDKIKQWTHTRYLKNMDGVRAHMAKHAALIRPKFEAVDAVLSREIKPLGIGSWIRPKGGYFICFEAMEGCAKAIVAKAKEAGIVMTSAGAPFPYGIDPKDSVIRIAPTFPNLEEMQQAAEVFACCVKLVSVEKLLDGRRA